MSDKNKLSGQEVLGETMVSDSQYNVCIALQAEVIVKEYVDAGIEQSPIPASTSASVFVYSYNHKKPCVSNF